MIQIGNQAQIVQIKNQKFQLISQYANMNCITKGPSTTDGMNSFINKQGLHFPQNNYFYMILLMKNYNYLFKYIIVGSTSVGKSCLLLQYVDQKFRNAHQVTMGVEFGTNVIKSNQHVIKLHIWDTAGQESFQSMIRAYYRNAIGCILVFDLTDRKSFEAIIRWHTEVISYTGNDIQIIIVGNKNDLHNRREVLEKEAFELATQLNAIYMEASALSGFNVVQIFENLTQQILKEIQNGKIDPQNEIYGIKIGDFERRRNSDTIPKKQRRSVQVSYPIQNQRWECC